MKTIVKISLALLLFLQIGYAKIFTSIYRAMPEAQLQKKLVAFFIVSNRCPHCQNLLADVGNNQELVNLLKQKYVFVVTDVANGGKVPADLPFDGTVPTILILTPTGEVVGNPITGEIPSNMLYKYLYNLEELKEKVVR